MRHARSLVVTALLTTLGLLAAACDQQEDAGPPRRARGPQAVRVKAPAAPAAPAAQPTAAQPAAAAPAPTAAAAGTAATAEAAAKLDDAEEPKDYQPEDALKTSLVAEVPAQPAVAAAPAAAAQPAAAPAPAPAPVPAAAPAEAFADSEPPDPVYEEKPRAPSAAHYWTPGFWGWAGTRWSWHPGVYRVRPAGMTYIAPHYEVVGGRVVYVGPHWGPRVVPRFYGGRVLHVRYPLVRPAYWRPGYRYVARPSIGFRIGSRPVAYYRTYPRVTSRIVVPARPMRVVRPGLGVRPVVGVRPGMGMRPGMGVRPMGPRPMVAPRPMGRPGVRVAPGPRSRRP